jgi:hypothetical protein
MADAVRVATFPFRVVWRLVKLLFLPVVVTAVTGWIAGTDSAWFLWTALVCGLWALVLANLWRIQTVGELRSLARGTVRIDNEGRSRRGRRPVRGDAQ